MYLLEETPEAEEMRKKVIHLAQSEDFVNTMIAVELIKNNGFHKDFENLSIYIENQRLLWGELFEDKPILDFTSSVFVKWFTFETSMVIPVKANELDSEKTEKIKSFFLGTKFEQLVLSNENWVYCDVSIVSKKLTDAGLCSIPCTYSGNRYCVAILRTTNE